MKLCLFRKVDDEPMTAEEVLTRVYQSIQEKGYNPINQILGYLISGDPAYITSHNNARSDIRRLEQDDLIEGIVERIRKGKTTITRIMSLDVGSRTIGIACSDALLMTAQRY